uniref:Uncharacterized protein n=1 Tax=Caulerpa lentillifera TaxID=148947 RepID=A0A2Z2QKI2_9CHLO|nr:hypothetical protein [Caulerpa lentillifera]AST24240.1 hypothetical protein [Caulerpa lentillifera]
MPTESAHVLRMQSPEGGHRSGKSKAHKFPEGEPFSYIPLRAIYGQPTVPRRAGLRTKLNAIRSITTKRHPVFVSKAAQGHGTSNLSLSEEGKKNHCRLFRKASFWAKGIPANNTSSVC